MEFLAELWLPILVSAVIVFMASFLAWMVLPHHRADIKVLPDESKLTGHLKSLSLPPGLYMWPNCQTGEEMKSDEFKQRFASGPWGTITIMGAKPNFARNLFVTFMVYLVISLFVGYITFEARAPGAPYLSVFQIAGAVAVLGYVAGAIPTAVFLGKPLRFVMTDMIDGVIFGLLTAGTFAWLWPDAASVVPT